MTIFAQSPKLRPVAELQPISALQPIRQRLRFAQQRLQVCDIPFQLAAVSYLRICCSAKQSYQRLGFDLTSPTSSTTPYQMLLSQLIAIDPDWWKLCCVSTTGSLISSDRRIRELLQPLNTFVEQIVN